MATVTIGNKLQQERTITIDNPIPGVLDGLVRSNDVHPVDLKAWNLVTAGVVLRVHGAALVGGTHSVLVVFADENAWEVPELGLTHHGVRGDLNSP